MKINIRIIQNTKNAALVITVPQILIAQPYTKNNTLTTKTSKIKISSDMVFSPSNKLLDVLNSKKEEINNDINIFYEILIQHNVPKPAIEFSKIFNHSPVFLTKLDTGGSLDGFGVGEVLFPSLNQQQGLIIVNSDTEIRNVSDLRKFNSNELLYDKDFISLKINPSKCDFLSTRPPSYEIQPGEQHRTEIRVPFSVFRVIDRIKLGTAYLVFEFSWPGRKFVGIKLDYFEKTASY